VRTLRFSKTKRLILPSEFDRVREEGRTTRGASLMLGVLETNGGSTFRAGFVTSKRIGNAVVRNRVRRRLREIVRKHQLRLPRNIWVVTIARPGAARATFAELEDEWLRLARRAFILPP
jgi:ribonuclease P protein component